MGGVGRCWGLWPLHMYVVWGKQYGIDGNMCQWYGHIVGCGTCGRVWGHVAAVVGQ